MKHGACIYVNRRSQVYIDKSTRPILGQSNRVRSNPGAAYRTLEGMVSQHGIFKNNTEVLTSVLSALQQIFNGSDADAEPMLMLSWIATELLKEIWPVAFKDATSLREASDQLLCAETVDKKHKNDPNVRALQEVLLYALYYGSGLAGRVLVLLMARGIFSTIASKNGHLPFDEIEISYLQFKHHQEFYLHDNIEIRQHQFLPVYVHVQRLLTSLSGEELISYVFEDAKEVLEYINELLPIDQYCLGRFSDFILHPKFLSQEDDQDLHDSQHVLSIIRASNLQFVLSVLPSVFKSQVRRHPEPVKVKKLPIFLATVSSLLFDNTTMSEISAPEGRFHQEIFTNLFGWYLHYFVTAILSDLVHLGVARVKCAESGAQPVTIQSLMTLLQSFYDLINKQIEDDNHRAAYYQMFAGWPGSPFSLLLFYKTAFCGSSTKVLQEVTAYFTSLLFINPDSAMFMSYLLWIERSSDRVERLTVFSSLIDQLRQQKVSSNDKETIHGRLIDLLIVMVAIEGDRSALQILAAHQSVNPVLRRQTGEINERVYHKLIEYITRYSHGALPHDWLQHIVNSLQELVDPECDRDIAYFLGKTEKPLLHISHNRSSMYQSLTEEGHTDNSLDAKLPG